MVIKMKEFIFNILKGIVIGISNVIPGVSGGTMMVSMGIYDKLIFLLTHFIKKMKEAIAMLIPLGIGMVLAIALFSKLFSHILFPKFPVQTNMFFIGLILGGLPLIYGKVKGNKIKIPSVIAFIAFFVLVVGLAVIGKGSGATADTSFSVINVIKLFGVGVVAAATMVIPGVSGSMMMLVLGYYYTFIDTISALTDALKAFDIAAILDTFTILVPFGIGAVIGVVVIAKLVEYVLKNFPLITYWAIIGLVVASPVAIVIMMDVAAIGVVEIISGIVLFALGAVIAYILGE